MMKKHSNPYLEDALENRAVIFKPKEGETLRIKGTTVTLKVTSSISNDQLGIYEISLEPGTVGAQLHYHRFMDETFIVNEGTLSVQYGQNETEAEPGSVIYVPRFTPHGFSNQSDKPVCITLIFNPAQKREGFFFGLEKILNNDPVIPEDFLALYNKYDSFPVDTSNMLPLPKAID
jgi:quercetin dioxygenase-like cupin family protein